MRIAAAVASAALFLSPLTLATAHADPDPVQCEGRGANMHCHLAQGSNLVDVQDPNNPQGTIKMTQAEAEQIADPPPSFGGSGMYGNPNVWTLKPAPSLIDRINQGAGEVNRVLCMGIPNAIKPPSCP